MCGHSMEGLSAVTIGLHWSSAPGMRRINESEQVHMFDLHQNPNDECIVGRHIRPVLAEVFRGIEEKAGQALKHTTLVDCMQKMNIEIDKE